MNGAGIEALLFDVFGTVVDWRGSVIREAAVFGRDNGIDADWEAFADAWRGKYGPFMDRVRSGELPWTNLDGLHRLALEELLQEFGIEGVDEAAKAELESGMAPAGGVARRGSGPDPAQGALHHRGAVQRQRGDDDQPGALRRPPLGRCPRRRAGACLQPDPKTYLTAVELLGLEPRQVMMVAAHAGDLDAARGLGLKTAFVPRPLERGPAAAAEQAAGSYDVVAADFRDLAHKLGG